MTDTIIYTKGYCPYCKGAKQLLDARGIDYTEIDVMADASKLDEMISRSQRRTVPQIFFGEQHIGGYTDLVQYFARKAA